MILRLQSFFALLTAALLALGSSQAKPASGGYQLFEQGALEHQQHIQLSSLGNFDYFARLRRSVVMLQIEQALRRRMGLWLDPLIVLATR